MPPLRFFGVLAAFFAVSASVHALDQVIFRDGFSIIGKKFREEETIVDQTTGTKVVLPKLRGFDVVETGAKYYIFSNKAQQVGKVLENVNNEKELDYRKNVTFKSGNPLPSNTGTVRVGEFNNNWKRITRVDLPAIKGFAEIEQQIATISPSRVAIPSVNYRWYPVFDTKEMDPALIRKLLLMHESFKEPNGPEAAKRLDLAQFFRDAGWLDFAMKEIDDTKKLITAPWPKDVTERADKLTESIYIARTTILTNNLERAVKAGQYQRALELSKAFDEKTADAQAAKQFATYKAQLDKVEPDYQTAVRLLDLALKQLQEPVEALVGPAALTAHQVKHPKLTLRSVGEQVLAELHHDTIDRVEAFRTLAIQAERRIASNQDPGITPEKLIALAVTGWIKGRNGAEQSTEAALLYAKWRAALMAYQTEPIRNNRRDLYLNAAKTGPLPPDEIAQIISYLPPPEPENLKARTGTVVVEGIYQRNTGAVTETAKGVNYLVRLPREYHHGRPTRLLVALTNHNVPAEMLVEKLAPDADRHGYIIIAPQWITQFDTAPYDWRGDKHYIARAAIRDALKHFRIDGDRVFLIGYGNGADYAMDLGASHPDQFAGVCAMGPNPKDANMFMNYWRNAQKLPMYLCVGQVAGDSFKNTRLLFEKWMEKGYPAIASIWRGRGQEWFSPEVPIMFDWMEPKKRITGTATLRINEPVEPWISMRDADNRFYWIGSDKIHPSCKLPEKVNQSFNPAEIKADIKQGNRIEISIRGTNNVVIWLDRNLIDWTKPVTVLINGSAPQGYKPKVVSPDIEFMLEQLYASGDRSLLFLNKMEFPTLR